MQELQKCVFCGKEYVIHEIKALGIVRKMQFPDCNCRELQEEKEKQLKLEHERQEKAKQKTDAIKKVLNCPLISPLFQDKTFEKLQELEKNVQVSEEYLKHKEKCVQYAKDFQKGSSGLFMIGGVGTGKTTLQACIIKELEKRGKLCLLINFSTLLDLFIQACNFESGTSVLELYRNIALFDYIVLDDIGREKYTDKRLEFAFRVIDTLMNHKVTVSVTANPECFKKLGSIPEYKAIVDRLRDMCPNNMTFNGTSFRGANVTKY